MGRMQTTVRRSLGASRGRRRKSTLREQRLGRFPRRTDAREAAGQFALAYRFSLRKSVVVLMRSCSAVWSLFPPLRCKTERMYSRSTS